MNRNNGTIEKTSQQHKSDTWPIGSWHHATPEDKGMDSAKLAEMMDFYTQKRSKNENIVIDSITIVRDGCIIADLYPNPMFPKETKHIIHSCTKSIVSALIGIAIEKGYIKNVDVPVLDLLTEKKAAVVDVSWNNITLKDLLTMQTGLRSEDSYLYAWRGLFKMQASDDWTRHILGLPVEVKPGQRFDYSNMSSFLLSAIITAATGIDTLSFARKHLFEPLGIHDVQWEHSPEGVYIGYARLWLKPHDMAKIGWLYLHKGQWDGKQIVPADWVKESTRTHSHPKKYRRFRDENGKVQWARSTAMWLFTNLVRPFSEGYGYQWWLDKNGMYTALGTSGQYIIVVPDERLVAVFTGKLSGTNVFIPATMLKKFILPAVISDRPLPTNKAAQQKLAAWSELPALAINRLPVPSLPGVAHRISGQKFSLEPNPWRNDAFQLTFEQGQAHAAFRHLTQGHIEVCYQVGLDNTYRFTDSGENTYAAMGAWTSPNTFVIDYEMIGYSNTGKWSLTFADNEIQVEEVGVTGSYTYNGTMRKVKRKHG